MRFAEANLYAYKLPYRRRITWFDSSENESFFVALRLTADDGSHGWSETAIKPHWSGMPPHAFANLLRDEYLPALEQTDLSDASAVSVAVQSLPANHLCRMMIDNACATLLAASVGRPYWNTKGGTREVEMSWCVTRQPPQEMVHEAVSMIENHGFGTLKIKGGQGFDIDLNAIRSIRRAVGPKVTFMVDANGAYSAEDAGEYVKMLDGEGVVVAEDPYNMEPDDDFSRLVADSPIPILVDAPSVTIADAEAFLAAGATALNVKPGRVGFAEAERIVSAAEASDAGVCSGMSAESALGTLISLQSASALENPLLPAEQSIFMMLREQVTQYVPEIRNGKMVLPQMADFDDIIDWDKLSAFSV